MGQILKKYFLEILLLFFVALFIFWSIGYFANAIYGTKFALESCWAGFTALGGAGFLATVKYIMDSRYNSDEGVLPYASKIISSITANKIIEDGAAPVKKEEK